MKFIQIYFVFMNTISWMNSSSDLTRPTIMKHIMNGYFLGKLQKSFDFSKTFRLSSQTDDQNNKYRVANEEHREFISDIFMKKLEACNKKFKQIS